MKKLALIFCFCACFISFNSYASTEADQNYIHQLVNGGPNSIRYIARKVIQSDEVSQEVRDVLAEILLQNYDNPDKHYFDALSWVCKALGRPNQARYRNALTEVAEKAESRKLRKFAQLALDNLQDGDASQYVKGAVSLEQLKKLDAASNQNAETK